MTCPPRWISIYATISAAAMTQPIPAAAHETTTAQPRSSAEVAALASNLPAEPALTHAEKLALLKAKIKYVFVLFQENRSFDFHFGTFPGAHGLFSKPAAQTPGFTQVLVGTDGTPGTISPFLIPQTVRDVNGRIVPLYPADVTGVDHTHRGLINDLDATPPDGVSRNDRYALNQEGLTTRAGQVVSLATGLPATRNPTLAQKQQGEFVMAHDDCDTVPFLWRYADRFVLFDDFHQTIIGPSAPNAIAMIAGQSGETQWALHPSVGNNNTANPAVRQSRGEPIVSNKAPFPGSGLDTAPVRPPGNPRDEKPDMPFLTQTYASLPLSFMGRQVQKIVQSDENPALDLLDIQDDIAKISSDNLPPTNWGWYQEGYDHEPTDGANLASHATYVWHHNGPQFFGYVGDNPKVTSNLHGLGDFFADVAAQSLPAKGGVFYVRGGYGNNDRLKPLDPNPAVQASYLGSDDHPGYSDAQISEALLADEVNAIAASTYWKDSAIIIAYDETDGEYDHMVPHVRELDPEGNPLAAGPRIASILISPYGQSHVIDHAYSEHSSVIKFIDALYGLTPLADLPDEAKGRKLGASEFGQKDLGPADTQPYIDDLASAFDNNRLTGKVALLPASYAIIPPAIVHTLPHYGSSDGGCRALGIVPTDYQDGKLVDPAPPDFNPRPLLTPGVPGSGTWTP